MRPKCSVCGDPASVGADLDSPHPDWRCFEHLRLGTVRNALKLMRLAAGQRRECLECGGLGLVPVFYDCRIAYFCHAHSGEYRCDDYWAVVPPQAFPLLRSGPE